ncbi:MAG: STAS domain-containing protein [bacterium]
MLIKVENHGSVTVVSFEVEDQFNDPEPLRQVITERMDAGFKDFLIDLENIVYMSSSSLGFIITLYQQLKKKGGRLKLMKAQPSVSNLIEITRLDRLLEMFDDQDTALRSFG